MQNTKFEDILLTLIDQIYQMALAGEDMSVILGKVEMLAELHPETLRRTYKFRMVPKIISPLAALCFMRAPQKLIEIVFDLFPPAIHDAIGFACMSGHIDIIQFFRKKCPAVMSMPDPITETLSLHTACIGNQLDMVCFVYNAYPQALAHKDRPDGRTPIHWALWLSDLPIIKYLTQQIDGNKAVLLRQANTHGETPLHLAFHNKRKKVSEYVVRHFPDFLKEARDDILSPPYR